MALNEKREKNITYLLRDSLKRRKTKTSIRASQSSHWWEKKKSGSVEEDRSTQSSAYGTGFEAGEEQEVMHGPSLRGGMGSGEEEIDLNVFEHSPDLESAWPAEGSGTQASIKTVLKAGLPHHEAKMAPLGAEHAAGPAESRPSRQVRLSSPGAEHAADPAESRSSGAEPEEVSKAAEDVLQEAHAAPAAEGNPGLFIFVCIPQRKQKTLLKVSLENVANDMELINAIYEEYTAHKSKFFRACYTVVTVKVAQIFIDSNGFVESSNHGESCISGECICMPPSVLGKDRVYECTPVKFRVSPAANEFDFKGKSAPVSDKKLNYTYRCGGKKGSTVIYNSVPKFCFAGEWGEPRGHEGQVVWGIELEEGTRLWLTVTKTFVIVLILAIVAFVVGHFKKDLSTAFTIAAYFLDMLGLWLRP